jgi:uridine phosphorylase
VNNIPLLEFDPDSTALIEPRNIYKSVDLPECCVMPIYGSLIVSLKQRGKLTTLCELVTGAGSLFTMEVLKVSFEGREVAVVFPGMGAPFVAAMFEEMIARGCRRFIACGSGGVLKSELKRGTVVIPSSAIRDEGTSYHYLPPSRTVDMDPGVVRTLESVLQRHDINFETGKTWTTDAFYRETRGKISRRKEEGCLMVEMECSAFLAVAQFRGVTFGQYLGAGDDVSGANWDPRYVRDKMPFEEKLFWLSVEASLTL